jgi:hypothetical protein
VRVVRCEHCGLTRLDGNAVAEVPDPVRPADPFTERKAAGGYLAMFEARGGARHGLLVVADADHPFTAIAEAAGLAVIRA